MSRLTHAWISDGRTVVMRRSPSTGYTCSRRSDSILSALDGRCTCIARHRSPYTRTVTLMASGERYWPVTIAAVCSSSQRCASTLRRNACVC